MNFEYICVYIRAVVSIFTLLIKRIIGKKVPHRMIDRIDVASCRSHAHARRNDDPGLEYAWLAARLRNYI